MNPKIFAKAFSDIKKQAQLELAKNTTKQNNVESKSRQTQTKDKVQANIRLQIVNSDDEEKSKKIEGVQKKIVKQNLKKGEAIIKKWKDQLYKKEAVRKARLILIENSSSKEVLNVIKEYKMDIEQFSEDRILMNSQQKAKQCMQLLRKSGIKVKSSDQPQKQEIVASQSKEGEKGSIFSRIQ